MSVILKKPLFKEVSNKEIAQQLESKKKCFKKLPTWYNTPKIYYPKKIHIEQTSSESSALYKSQLVQGKRLLDITTGLGVDAYFFSKKFDELILCEKTKELAIITQYNLKVLGILNTTVLPQDGLEYLKTSQNIFDWIYSDPGRRHQTKGKVFRLADCSPDIPRHLDLLFSKTSHILIKTSPLLDLSLGIKELRGVKEIHILSVDNEVKELLWVLEKGFKQAIKLHCCNIEKGSKVNFNFSFEEEKATVSEYSHPLTYLYEPNLSILKAGAFKCIGRRYGLKKLHEHTHLFTSDELLEFPGRVFKINKVSPYHKNLGKSLNLRKANISTRNFPESVATIRKKTKIKDGGNHYVFFVKDVSGELRALDCYKMF
ncbi:THUMP-like domain-containing protein [Eudoraea chungangensis]|uniref:THUMP-like domain-containing protein n=1 Tax=Eudoraea chungangensis TaxID=1481905 RepID=UPI0030B9E4D0